MNKFRVGVKYPGYVDGKGVKVREGNEQFCILNKMTVRCILS